MSARPDGPPQREVEPVDVEVYDGRIALGRVRTTPDGYRALDAEGGDLGLFTSIRAASNEIIGARRRLGPNGLAPRDLGENPR